MTKFEKSDKEMKTYVEYDDSDGSYLITKEGVGWLKAKGVDLKLLFLALVGKAETRQKK